MKHELSGGLYYISTYIKKLMIIFWSILISIIVVTIGINYFIGGAMQVDLTLAVAIFSSILGFNVVKEVFPYMIKMGITRKVIFLTTGISFFILSLGTAIILQVIYLTTDIIYDLLKLDKVNIIPIEIEYNGVKTTSHDLTQMISDTIIAEGFINISLMLFILFSMLIIGLIFYNYGVVAGVSFLAILLLVLVSSATNGYIELFVGVILDDFGISLFYKLFAMSLVMYLLSYLGIFRMTIKQ